jgi:hypothetical protein
LDIVLILFKTIPRNDTLLLQDVFRNRPEVLDIFIKIGSIDFYSKARDFYLSFAGMDKPKLSKVNRKWHMVFADSLELLDSKYRVLQKFPNIWISTYQDHVFVHKSELGFDSSLFLIAGNRCNQVSLPSIDHYPYISSTANSVQHHPKGSIFLSCSLLVCNLKASINAIKITSKDAGVLFNTFPISEPTTINQVIEQRLIPSSPPLLSTALSSSPILNSDDLAAPEAPHFQYTLNKQPGINGMHILMHVWEYACLQHDLEHQQPCLDTAVHYQEWLNMFRSQISFILS